MFLGLAEYTIICSYKMEIEEIVMGFTIKPTRKKREALTKSLYLSKELADKLEKMATENDTSFSNVVVSMIEYCLKEQESEQERET